MGPIDYSAAIVNPLQSVLQGLQLGAQLRVQQEERARQQAAAEREQAFMRDIADKVNTAASSDDIFKLTAKYPEKFDILSKFWGSMDERKKGFMFDTGRDALMRLKPTSDGGYDATASIATLEERALAAENSGDKATAKSLRDTAQIMRDNPASARFTLATSLVAADKDRGKAIVDAAFGGQGEQTQLQKQYDWLKAIKGRDYADRWLAVETDKFVPVAGQGGKVYRASDLLQAGTPMSQPEIPAGPSMATVPPPRLKSDGNPVGLTPEQYQVTVAEMGKEATDAWMKRNGIPLIQPTRTATVNGKTFYQVNGKWYDNPEGR